MIESDCPRGTSTLAAPCSQSATMEGPSSLSPLEGKELVGRSSRLLCGWLEGYGNRPSVPHQLALRSLLQTFTDYATRTRSGRYAFGLPTGTGKTLAVISWITSVVLRGHEQIGVAVSACKVEALCQIKRALIEAGVPEDRIGLIHSYACDHIKVEAGEEGYASEPSTGDDDRQIMLITHSRVRSQNDKNIIRFSQFRGQPRDLLIYDESLIVSESTCQSVECLRIAACGLAQVNTQGPLADTAARTIRWFGDVIAKIDSARLAAETGLHDESIIRIAPPEGVQPQEALQGLQRYRKAVTLDGLQWLLDLAPASLRVIPDYQGGVLRYEIVVPPELKNIVVLDASRPIRQLCQEDRTVKDAEQYIPAARACPVPFAQLKDHSDVTIRHWSRGGGRGSMRKDFSENRQVVKAVVDVVKGIAADQAVLIFTFKHRPSDGRLDYIKTLRSQLHRSGIDLNAKLSDGSRRINFAWWGQHESINEYSHCRHVILAGVLHLPHHVVAAQFVGQANDLARPFPKGQLDELVQSEACHAIYQALSRGACRKTIDGKARQMDAWIIHPRKRTVETLRDVMPNVRIVPWEPQRQKRRRRCDGKIHKLAQRIASYLNDPQARQRGTLSIRQLKRELEVAGRWEHARREAIPAMTPGWSLDGRSVVFKSSG